MTLPNASVRSGFLECQCDFTTGKDIIVSLE
jgi:hypothetical protein